MYFFIYGMMKDSRCENNEGKCISANRKCSTKIIAKICENPRLVCCKKTTRRTQNDIVKKNKGSYNLGKKNLKNKVDGKLMKKTTLKNKNNKKNKKLRKKNKKSNKKRRKMKRVQNRNKKFKIKQKNKEKRILKRKKSLGKKKSRQDLEEKKSK